MDAIILRGVKTHNLKNFDLILNHRKLYVISGVSGSGKSSLAFDTLYAEGQRRYVESMSAYARQFLERMEKPDVESVIGIPPAIALEAKNGINNARSTVGTQTEVNDYLRVFFARIGRTFCPDCKTEVSRFTPESVAGLLSKNHGDSKASVLFTRPLGKQGAKYLKDFLPELARQGFTEFYVNGSILDAAGLLKLKKDLPGELPVVADRLTVEAKSRKRLVETMELAFRYGQGRIQVVIEAAKVPAKPLILKFSEGFNCSTCGRSFREPAPNMFSFNSPLGACSTCQGFGREITLDWNLVIPDANRTLAGGAIEPWTKPSSTWEFNRLLKFCARRKIPVNKPWKDLPETHRRMILEGLKGDEYFSVKAFFEYLEKKTYKMHVRVFLSKYRQFVTCPSCRETRLKPEALWVKVRDKNIYELQMLSISDLDRLFTELQLAPAEREKVEPVYLEMQKRVRFLKEVGLGYLSLSRLSRTLSGGEVQRINLATSLGAALVDTLYVLDEPSIGLHERDNDLLIRLLKELRDLGNTVVVVEHDRTMIEAADEVIDLGPLGGRQGGSILFQGPVSDIKKSSKSLTGQYLAGTREVLPEGLTHPASPLKGKKIRIRKAGEHNLRDIDVDIPLGQFVVITGVSGSGKSTLLYEILYHHYLRHQGKPVQDLGRVKSIEGFEHVDEIVVVDQSPMGRSPRSNPVTYLKAFDDIRKIFSRQPEARRQGFGPGHFSFNVDGGRCAVCKGDGRVKIEMHFLADVYVPCEECQGKRFKPEILKIRFKGKNLDDVLGMTADDAVDFFAEESGIKEKLTLIRKVGLGYLQLGQSALTLSGGEAQRLKLAYEISQRNAKHILYLFDEPTTGLHYHDIHYLMQVFRELLLRGHSIVVIEHNMEVIRWAETIIDLGPEGGDAGGRLVYSGDIKGILKCPESFTGLFLKRHFEKLKNTAVQIPVSGRLT